MNGDIRMPRRPKNRSKLRFDQVIWKRTPQESVDYKINSHNFKAQKFTKIDACAIMEGLNCSGPVAVCCSVLLDYLMACMKGENAYEHSAAQFQDRALPCCTLRQVKQYLKKMEDCGFLSRRFTSNKVSIWTVEHEKITNVRVRFLRETMGNECLI